MSSMTPRELRERYPSISGSIIFPSIRSTSKAPDLTGHDFSRGQAVPLPIGRIPRHQLWKSESASTAPPSTVPQTSSRPSFRYSLVNARNSHHQGFARAHAVEASPIVHDLSQSFARCHVGSSLQIKSSPTSHGLLPCPLRRHLQSISARNSPQAHRLGADTLLGSPRLCHLSQTFLTSS